MDFSSEGRWVKVEFWGLLPDGQDLSALDPLDVAVLLAQPFAFTHVDCITAVPGTGPAARGAGDVAGRVKLSARATEANRLTLIAAATSALLSRLPLDGVLNTR